MKPVYKTASFSIREDQLTLVDRLADVTGMSKSEIVRDVIDIATVQMKEMIKKAERRSVLRLKDMN